MATRRLLILYGSQTGTAQEISERIWRQSKRYHFSGPVQAMDDYPIAQLLEERYVVFVCSTTGQGEEPENMRTFWKFLLRKNLPSDSLKAVKFGVLGLGDSSYAKYNYAAKKLYRRLLSLGGTSILPLGLADDQHDLGVDAVVDPWVSQLWSRLLEHNPLPPEMPPLPEINILPRWKITLLETSELPDLPIMSHKPNVFPVLVESNDRITSPTHFQDVRFISLKNLPPHAKYQPGDVLMVKPQNLPENVEAFLEFLTGEDARNAGSKLTRHSLFSVTQSDSDMIVPPPLQVPQSLENLATHYWDLNAVPRRYTLQLLSEVTPNELEKEKLMEMASAEGQEIMFDYLNRPRRTILELLGDFPHAASNIPYPLLFEIFSAIQPRAFSIASSPNAHKGKLHILVAVVRYRTKLFKPRLGLCSNWLARLKPNDLIHVWLQKGSFRFVPQELQDRPIIMVGPGTGVAPFRSYIHERNIQGTAQAKTLQLYFGCRNKNGDFHFSEEWRKLEEQGKLTMHCAFSRDQTDKVYVQHIISKNAKIVWKLLESGGHVFVAGNSKNMPRDVRDSIRDLMVSAGGLSLESATEMLDQMEKGGRYQTETWG